MDKKQEIAVLQSLVGDTYFNQFFGKHDIDQMCENIKNDFPIETDCQFYQKAVFLQQKVEEEKAKQKEIYRNYAKGLIDDFDGDIPEEIHDRLVDSVGELFIIDYKREQDYGLSDDEIDWMIDELKSRKE